MSAVNVAVACFEYIGSQIIACQPGDCGCPSTALGMTGEQTCFAGFAGVAHEQFAEATRLRALR
jgi:hypothetical protein